MPIKKGKGKKIVGQNIVELLHAGRPRKQAVAIALKNAGLSRKKTRKKRRGK